MFDKIIQLQELMKSYYIALRYDADKAADLLNTANSLRLEIAIDAEMREIFYGEEIVPPDSTGYQRNIWFSKNDTEYLLKRIVAALNLGVTIAAVNQGNRQRIITRELLAWQHIFPSIPTYAAFPYGTGQQTLFDFPQEIFFAENEAIGLSIQGQSDINGYLFYHGCTLKDSLEDVRKDDIQTEIASYLPEPQIIPLIFQFPENTAGSIAIDASGSEDIFTAKYNRSIILTEISTTLSDFRATITDEGRNQLICNNVDVRGISGNYLNQYTTYYKLPYPHLLRRGDRLKLRGINGSRINSTAGEADTLYFLTFKGYSM